MSDAPQGERDPVPASVEHSADHSAEGTAVPPGRPASRAEAAARPGARRRIGIRELRQHASVYVDLAERGYTVDITNRGRLVAQLVPVREPGSPLERLIAAGIIESAEEPGGVADIEPYPSSAGRRPPAGEVPGQAPPPEDLPPEDPPPEDPPPEDLPPEDPPPEDPPREERR